MKIRLSMPSTTSIAIRVTSAAQAAGSDRKREEILHRRPFPFQSTAAAYMGAYGGLERLARTPLPKERDRGEPALATRGRRAGQSGMAGGFVTRRAARAVMRVVQGCRAGSGACWPPAAPVCYRARKPPCPRAFMNDQSRPSDLSLMKFGIGQPVPRKEDPMLVRGEGRYSDDVQPRWAGLRRLRPQPLRARPHPGHRGRDRRRDAGRARGLHRRRSRGGRARSDAGGVRVQEPRRHADDEAAAPGAAERPRALCRPAGRLRRRRDGGRGARRRRGGGDRRSRSCRRSPTRARRRRPARRSSTTSSPSNVVLDYHFGDAAKVDAAFAAAAHVTRLELSNNRLVVSPLEPRAAVAEYDRGERPAHHPCRLAGRLRHARRDRLAHPRRRARRRCAS